MQARAGPPICGVLGALDPPCLTTIVRQRKMRARISKISLIVFVVMVALGGFLLSVPGDYWLWFAITATFAIVPLVLGPRRNRWAGFAGLVLSAVLIAGDYGSGKAFHEKIERAKRISADRSKDGTNDGRTSRSSEPAPRLP